MRVRRLLAPVVLVGLIATLLPSVALAVPTTLVDRGLPTSGINAAVVANRSNVAWSNGNEDISGDSFSVGSTGEHYIISTIRTWSVQGNAPDASNQLGDWFSDVKLYFGKGAVEQIATGYLTVDSNSNTNTDITHTPVTYAGGADYQRLDTTFAQIWQNDFNNLNLEIDGGVTYYFSVEGTPRDPVNQFWRNHATNAALAGSPQQGSNDRWNAWIKTDLTTPFDCDSSTGNNFTGECNGGWDKTSDINVQVFGAAAPPAPSDLTITKSHTGNFRQLNVGTYQIRVSNVGEGPTDGKVTVKDVLPKGLIAFLVSGSGWHCTTFAATCTRSDVLAAGASYPPITVRVFIGFFVAAQVTNVATVSGGGDAVPGNNSASDPTTITRLFSFRPR